MYVKSNTEECSCNHCSSGKLISITYSVCVTVALDIQNAKHMHDIVTCDLPHYNIFPHCLINGKIFFFWGGDVDHKVCILIIFIFILCKKLRHKVKQPTTCTSVFCF